MGNKFKLWFHKNGRKVILIIIGVLLVYFIISRIDNYYDKKEDTFRYDLSDISYDMEDEEVAEKLNLNRIESSSNEYEQVSQVVNKFAQNVYQARSTGDEELKSNLVGMLTDDYIETGSDIGEVINAENILDYCPYIEDVNKFSIKQIDKYSERGSISIYIVTVNNSFEDEGEVVEDESLLALHMDYDNHTFAFDKPLLYLADAVNLENLGEIDNNGSNTF